MQADSGDKLDWNGHDCAGEILMSDGTFQFYVSNVLLQSKIKQKTNFKVVQNSSEEVIPLWT